MTAVGGCQEPAQITSYSVPKQKVIEAQNQLEPTDRMLAAILPQSELAWFVKVTGPVDELGEHEDAFREFVESITFTGPQNRPTWQLPAGWRQADRSGSQMAYATLEFGKPPMQLTVTPLPFGDQQQQDLYVLANVNRWRRQLTLSPVKLAELDEVIERVPVGDASAILVNLAGRATADGSGMPPMARATPPAGAAARQPARPAAGQPTDVTYTKPDNWQPGRKSSMRKAAFVVTDGEQQVETTIIPLPRDANDVFSNVNRWRGQVGLPPIAQDQLADQVEALPVGPLSGNYVALFGQDQALLGTIIFLRDQAWFVKMFGDVDLAKREQANYEAFTRSIRFDPPPTDAETGSQ